jgi:hypothetical protein
MYFLATDGWKSGDSRHLEVNRLQVKKKFQYKKKMEYSTATKTKTEIKLKLL